MKEVAAIKPVADPAAGASQPAPAPKAAPAKAPEIHAVRLVIEEDRSSGSFVYKTLDRVTGEVLAQYPREELLRMLSREDYAAGDVIKTRA
jgi:flagellar protein FlaG